MRRSILGWLRAWLISPSGGKAAFRSGKRRSSWASAERPPRRASCAGCSSRTQRIQCWKSQTCARDADPRRRFCALTSAGPAYTDVELRASFRETDYLSGTVAKLPKCKNIASRSQCRLGQTSFPRNFWSSGWKGELMRSATSNAVFTCRAVLPLRTRRGRRSSRSMANLGGAWPDEFAPLLPVFRGGFRAVSRPGIWTEVRMAMLASQQHHQVLYGYVYSTGHLVRLNGGGLSGAPFRRGRQLAPGPA